MVQVAEHLLEAFAAIVAENWQGYRDAFPDEVPAAEALLWQLANCSDIMPKELCEELSLPQEATYSMGVGAYLALNGLPYEEEPEED